MRREAPVDAPVILPLPPVRPPGAARASRATRTGHLAGSRGAVRRVSRQRWTGGSVAPGTFRGPVVADRPSTFHHGPQVRNGPNHVPIYQGVSEGCLRSRVATEGLRPSSGPRSPYGTTRRSETVGLTLERQGSGAGKPGQSGGHSESVDNGVTTMVYLTTPQRPGDIVRRQVSRWRVLRARLVRGTVALVKAGAREIGGQPLPGLCSFSSPANYVSVFRRYTPRTRRVNH